MAILNAADCEPPPHKDKEMLRVYPDQVLAGVGGRFVELVGALRGRRGNQVQVPRRDRSCCGRSFPVAQCGSRKRCRDSYPAGDEFILVYDVTGKVIPPGKIPLVVGAVVINVETAYNIAQA